MRYAALLLALALVCSCGGGSSTPDTSDGANQGQIPLQEDPAFLKTQQILQNCALSELAGLLDLMGLLQDALDPNAEPPEFRLTDFNPFEPTGFGFAVDFDEEEPDDLTGYMSFTDSEGTPTFPFNPLDLLAGGLDFASLMAAIADGTIVLVDYTAHRGVETTGTVAFAIEGGAPGDVSGTTVVNGENCVIALEFEAIDLDPTLGTLPSGTADAKIESGADTLEGTVSFDGSSIITVDMGLPGEPSYAFEYDLTTGQMKVVND